MTRLSRTMVVSTRVAAAVTLLTSNTMREISRPEASRSNSEAGSLSMWPNISRRMSASTLFATQVSA